MNLKNIVAGIIVFITIAISSCVKLDKVPQRPMNTTEIWNCYNQTDWNESKIRNELIGKWKWIYTVNYWTPDKARYTDNENLIIEFLNDSTLNVINNSNLDFITKWIIVPEDKKFYGLKLDSSINL